MTVKELILELSKFSEDLVVMDRGFDEFEKVYEETWTHNNYPYDKPDRKVIIIDWKGVIYGF